MGRLKRLPICYPGAKCTCGCEIRRGPLSSDSLQQPTAGVAGVNGVSGKLQDLAGLSGGPQAGRTSLFGAEEIAVPGSSDITY